MKAGGSCRARVEPSWSSSTMRWRYRSSYDQTSPTLQSAARRRDMPTQNLELERMPLSSAKNFLPLFPEAGCLDHGNVISVRAKRSRHHLIGY
jgi:hypothetical protein